MMKILFLGMSIYPVSYLLSAIIKLLGDRANAFEIPASMLSWLNIVFFDSILNRFFGTDLARLNTTISTIVWAIFIIILFAINTIGFVAIASHLPKNWKPIAIIILYVIFLIINCYAPEINL